LLVVVRRFGVAGCALFRVVLGIESLTLLDGDHRALGLCLSRFTHILDRIFRDLFNCRLFVEGA
jgi:hypothetical protein